MATKAITKKAAENLGITEQEAEKLGDAHFATPAETAVAEAQGVDSFTVTFRGEKFDIPRGTLTSFRMLGAMASNRPDLMLGELLGGDDSNFPRLLATVERGEAADVVLEEFFAAVNAAGQGNS